MNPHWSERYTDWLHTILPLDCPESLPVYLVTAHEIEAVGRDAAYDRCRAFTHSNLDLELQRWLEDRGLWRGRGFTSVFVDPDLPREQIFATTLHEFGHRIDDDWEKAAIKQWLAEHGKAFIEPTINPPIWPMDINHVGVKDDAHGPWFQHENQFIRAILHLRHRASRRGYNAREDLLTCAGSTYGLSERAYYTLALWNEPAEMQDVPLVDVLNADAPKAFHELFQADVAKFKAAKLESKP